MEKNVTCVKIPTVLSERHEKKNLRNTLKRFIATTAVQRKSLSVREKNFKVKNALYHQLQGGEILDCKKRSIRLSPIERQALKILTGERSLNRAVTVALCAMEYLDEHYSQEQTEYIIPASPYMGWKEWYLDRHCQFMQEIKNTFPEYNDFIDLFMGSGILSENTADLNLFKSITANYYDTTHLDYFQTIRDYTVTFKCLVLNLDYATSPDGEAKREKSENNIIVSLEAMQPDKASKLLGALVFFLQQNKVLLKASQKQLKDFAEISDGSLHIQERISLMLEEVKRRKTQNKLGSKNLNSLNPTGLFKKIDCIAKEVAALKKIEIANMDAIKLLKKHAGNPKLILICDPPYFDTLEYDEAFSFEQHIQMAKLLKKHADKGGIFFYFGRITAPRSQNTNAGIDYAPRDQIYQGKYDELFLGKGFFYLDYAYDKSQGNIERVTTHHKMKDLTAY